MLFKILDAQGRSRHGGCMQWSLPTQDAQGNWHPGAWMPAIQGELNPCHNGYHLAEERSVIEWLGEAIYEAEYRGERVDTSDKIVVRECRLLRRLNWNERTARLFAVWCARAALKLIANSDTRSHEACNVAERYANGEATETELSAARSAAWYAAESAAGSAAGSAAWYAAWYAAESAAGSAAGSAARSAQYQHLMKMIEALQ